MHINVYATDALLYILSNNTYTTVTNLLNECNFNFIWARYGPRPTEMKTYKR